MNEPGLTPLRDAIKVLNGFGRSLEAILPKLRHGYLAENADRGAATGAAVYVGLLPDAGGRVLPQRSTVTGGKPASEGPLALKRDLRETEGRLAKLEQELAQAEKEAETLTRDDRGADGAA